MLIRTIPWLALEWGFLVLFDKLIGKKCIVGFLNGNRRNFSVGNSFHC